MVIKKWKLMVRKCQFRLWAALFVFGVVAVTGAFAENSLLLLSDRADFVGAGQVVQLNELNSKFVVTNNYNSPGRGVQIAITSSNNSSNYWFLNFDAAGDSPLTVGEYTGATRFPFSEPGVGLSVSGQGRGCNTLTGRFKVHAIVYSSTMAIRSLALSFEQHCEGAEAALKGTVFYNYRPTTTVYKELLDARTQDLISTKVERDALAEQVAALQQQLISMSQTLNKVVEKLFKCVSGQLQS